MVTSIHSPQMIYQQIAKEVEAILNNISSTTDDQSLQDANNKATELLQHFQGQLNNNIESLQKNAEWDIFTIAFYGETNAGKSTLIESLRIILKEESKLIQQREFLELMQKYQLTEENIINIKKILNERDIKIEEIAQAVDAINNRFAKQESELQYHIDSLALLITAHYKQSNLWQKILNLWMKTPEQKEQNISRKSLLTLIGEKNRELGGMLYKKSILDAEYKEVTLQYADMEIQLAHLDTLADGKIIGDGRSDFTLDTTHYNFTINNQKFALLDVPGIEGKEEKVRDQIQSAVQKAHAIFYITGKATAPQKGDENAPGTLEKIKAHLNAQTEVWTVFNKRITNPHQLNRATLISEDEHESLGDLNTKMREQLGQNYRNVFSLSALPAFLSVAENLVPDTENAKKREKLLEKYDTPYVLEKSGMTAFLKLLTQDLIADCKNKITHSNFNKANTTVRAAITEISSLQQGTYSKLAKKLKEDAENANVRFDISLKSLKLRLENEGESAIDAFRNAARERVYDAINSDISNDEFKTVLESCIKKEHSVLETKLPELLKKELQKFQQEIEETVTNFQRYAKEIVSSYSQLPMNNNFELKIDIDNGLKLTSLLATLAGGALLFWNPVGWLVLAPALAGMVFAAYKAVRSFFSSDYKMSQQRKSADENLRKIANSIKLTHNEGLEKTFPEIDSKISDLRTMINDPAQQAAEINRVLKNTIIDLNKLSYNLMPEGAN